MDCWSLAEFTAQVDGWRRVHGAEEKPAAPTDDEFDAMLTERAIQQQSQRSKQ